MPSSASSRDISRRTAELSTYLDLGRTQQFPIDLPALPGFERTLDSVESAAAKIDDPDGRWLYGLFWFRQIDTIDELALESLSGGKHNQALRLWGQRIARGGREACASLLNRSALHFALTAVPGQAHFEQLRLGLESLGEALSEHAGTVRAEIPANRWSEMLRRIAEQLFHFATSVESPQGGPEHLGLIALLTGFPAEVRDALTARLTAPVFAGLEAAIRQSKALFTVGGHSEQGLLLLENALDVFARLRQAIGDEDPRLKALANRLSAAYFEWTVPGVEMADPLARLGQIIDPVDSLPVTSGVLDRARTVRFAETPAQPTPDSAPSQESPDLVPSAGSTTLAPSNESADLASSQESPEQAQTPVENAPAAVALAPDSERVVVAEGAVGAPSDSAAEAAGQAAKEAAKEAAEETVAAAASEAASEAADVLARAGVEPAPAATAQEVIDSGAAMHEVIADAGHAAANHLAYDAFDAPAHEAANHAAFAAVDAPAQQAAAQATASESAPLRDDLAPSHPYDELAAARAANVAQGAILQAAALPDRAAQTEAVHRSLADRMLRPLGKIEEVAALIEQSRPELAKLKALLGRDDPQYLGTCESLASLCLDRLVEMVDAEREASEASADAATARAVLDRAEIAARKIAMLDLGAEARDRVARFLGALRDLLDQDSIATEQNGGTSRLGRLPKIALSAGLVASAAAVVAWLMGG